MIIVNSEYFNGQCHTNCELRRKTISANNIPAFRTCIGSCEPWNDAGFVEFMRAWQLFRRIFHCIFSSADGTHEILADVVG